MKNKLIWAAIAVLALAIGLVALVGGNQSGKTVGATPTGITNFSALGLGPQDRPLTMMVSTGVLTQATGTIVSEKNPFGATSTVDMLILDVTTPLDNSFAAVTYSCGTTTVPGASSTASLINSGAIATGTTAFLVNGTYGEYAGQTPGKGNARVIVAPGEQVACSLGVASSSLVAQTIGGTYKIRWNR